MQPPLTGPLLKVYDFMRMTSGRAGARVAVVTLGVLSAAGGGFPAAEVEPALWSRLQRIESAFRRGDAQALRASLPARARVRVDLTCLSDGGGAYGPGQLQVVFERVFHENRTRQFSFRDEDVKVSPPGTAFARGRWVRRGRDEAGDTVDLLTFTLRDEGGDWRIHEILSSR